jgi:sugar/nucleoside kinase (ribokinase family)
MSKPFEIITVGNIFNENIQFPDHSIGPLLGATVSYSTVVLGRLGARVGIVSNVGGDIPSSLLKPIYQCGANTRGLHVRDHSPTTTTLLVYDDRGYKVIRYLKKAPPISFADIPKEYHHTSVVYFCAVDFEVSADTVKRLKTEGLITAADMGGFGGAHTSKEVLKEYEKDRMSILKSYAEHIDIGKASLEDCFHIFGDNRLSEERAVQRLLEVGIRMAVMTLGERGSIIATDTEIVRVPAIPTKVVDSTGAGDTFMAAFLLEYLRSSNAYDAGLFASATASLLIEKTGGVNVDRAPDSDQVRERIASFTGKKGGQGERK